MNRDRVRAELPTDVAASLDMVEQALGDTEAWERATRTVVLRLARQLLADDALGWNRPARTTFVTTCASPALRAIVPGLPVRMWGRRTVIDALCIYFELFGAADSLRQAA